MKEKIKTWLVNLAIHTKRVSFETILSIVLGYALFKGLYLNFPAPIQGLFLLLICVSIGILHAHLAGKFLFPKVDWSKKIAEQSGVYYVRFSLYIIIPIIYSSLIRG